MQYVDIGDFEKEIEKSYAKGDLTEEAERLLRIMSTNVGNAFRLPYRQNKAIKEKCIEVMLTNWKGYYESKKSIFLYFADLCKLTYSRECLKLKQQENQQTT